ncbi:hypothetical protein PCANC_03947 [Puccinia coronata f. sp. avenae]|uniref:Uncharacterized protein n=1 Tax=Puccinia coronata f. sp. avenae TaxID=200324 RepID=A0A2N5W1I0_9BASI|nr:hypothetical protein PCANC_03947 [Puccinia coronata f. sp. avenae]
MNIKKTKIKLRVAGPLGYEPALALLYRLNPPANISNGKNLPILSGNNFSAWKIKVQGYCMQHGLYKYFNNPNPPADDTQRADWDNKQIKSLLVGYYKSSLVQNQSLVYQEFLALQYKTTIATFLD